MRFLYLAVHYPKPDHTRDLVVAMGRLAAALHAAPGMVEESAWHDSDGGRILAMSTWVSEEAFQQALPLIQDAIRDVPFSDWEMRPRELFRLSELKTGS